MTIQDLFRHCQRTAAPIGVAEAVVRSGLSRKALLRRATREGWWRPYPEVLGIPGLSIDARTRAIAAVLHATGRTPDAVRNIAAVTRWSAAHLLGVRRTAPSVVEVAIPASRALSSHPGLTVVRSRLLLPEDVRTRHRVPVVTAAALLRDLAATTAPERLTDLAIDLEAARHLRRRELDAMLDRCGRFSGRPKLQELSRLLDRSGRTDSPVELRGRRRFDAEGIPLDRGQVRMSTTAGPPIHFDLGIASIHFGIEVDSMAHHSKRADLERDAARSNEVAVANGDWRVMRMTIATLRDDNWGTFIVQVRRVIASQSERHLGIPWPRPQDIVN